MGQKILLIILDGFGFRREVTNNAIHMALTPHWDQCLKTYPFCLLEASGTSVGLPPDVMGNSEVGHMNIGAGRVVPQDLLRINTSIEKGFFKKDEKVKYMATQKGVVHLLGLLSDGGVHSHRDHLKLLITAITDINPQKTIVIHPILDGRDSPPKQGVVYLKDIIEFIAPFKNVEMGVVSGRFYTMDRDRRWERTELAYKALTDLGENTLIVSDCVLELQRQYDESIVDEFILPFKTAQTKCLSRGDQLIFFNFRADRARQISQSIALEEFSKFKTPVKINSSDYLTFTEYQKDFPFPVLFPRECPQRTMGELVAERGEKQLRIAETEKYAHVTYFFNGGVESPFLGEERVLIESPRDISTYDEKPEMSAYGLTKEVLENLKKDYRLIVLNFANGDMVGHTGNQSAAIEAVEVLDDCVGRIMMKALPVGYDIIVTSDHGNCELMKDQRSGVPFTQHTMNPVPFVWVSERARRERLKNGRLADISPTILDILGWQKPVEMTGESLIKNK